MEEGSSPFVKFAVVSVLSGSDSLPFKIHGTQRNVSNKCSVLYI